MVNHIEELSKLILLIKDQSSKLNTVINTVDNTIINNMSSLPLSKKIDTFKTLSQSNSDRLDSLSKHIGKSNG
jgi:hypothetical protein